MNLFSIKRDGYLFKIYSEHCVHEELRDEVKNVSLIDLLYVCLRVNIDIFANNFLFYFAILILYVGKVVSLFYHGIFLLEWPKSLRDYFKNDYYYTIEELNKFKSYFLRFDFAVKYLYWNKYQVWFLPYMLICPFILFSLYWYDILNGVVLFWTMLCYMAILTYSIACQIYYSKYPWKNLHSDIFEFIFRRLTISIK